MNPLRLTLPLFTALSLLPILSAEEPKKTRDQQVREDLTEFTSDESWIYNDLAAATTAAAESKKPLFVVLRCIP